MIMIDTLIQIVDHFIGFDDFIVFIPFDDFSDKLIANSSSDWRLAVSEAVFTSLLLFDSLINESIH